MRTIQTDIVKAVKGRTGLRTGQGRDALSWHDDFFMYSLWGNVIAKGDTGKKEISVSDCGWPTSTTVSRLNAIFAGLDIPMSAHIRKGAMLYKIHGEPVVPGELHYYAGYWNVTITNEA